MRYRKLGTTGVEVSTQCLGTMMYGAMGNTDHEDCISQINHALDSGINFIDTAGIRDTRDTIENIGIGRAIEKARTAESATNEDSKFGLPKKLDVEFEETTPPSDVINSLAFKASVFLVVYTGGNPEDVP